MTNFNQNTKLWFFAFN